MVPVILLVALLEFATLPGVLHVLARQFCADLEAAAVDIVYPVLHALQSTVVVLYSQSVAPEGVPFGQIHAFWQIVSMVSSLGILARPTGHGEQESVSTNIPVPSGDDMYVSAGQHPNLAVLVPSLPVVNALFKPLLAVIDSHLLPHNVRLNPLSKNAAHKKKRA